MSTGPTEQRNPYRGAPARAWVRVRFIGADGAGHEMDLLVDTGNPFAVIVGTAAMQYLNRQNSSSVTSNFGPLHGAWVRVVMPELGLDHDLLGYANDVVARTARASSPDLEGLVGLPFLRLLEYGGDADNFWVRQASGGRQP